MNEIYTVVRQLVEDGYLNNANGFSGQDVLGQIQLNNIQHDFQVQSVSRSIWKHSDGGGNVPVVYYDRIGRALYKIKPQYL